MPRRDRQLAVDVLLGALTGAAATWAMDHATKLIQQRQPEKVTKRESRVRGPKSAYEIAAEKSAKLAGRRISKTQRQRIGAGIHYPIPIHLQPAFADLGYHVGDFPIGEDAAEHVLSLPLYPEIREEQQRYVVQELLKTIE